MRLGWRLLRARAPALDIAAAALLDKLVPKSAVVPVAAVGKRQQCNHRITPRSTSKHTAFFPLRPSPLSLLIFRSVCRCQVLVARQIVPVFRQDIDAAPVDPAPVLPSLPSGRQVAAGTPSPLTLRPNLQLFVAGRSGTWTFSSRTFCNLNIGANGFPPTCVRMCSGQGRRRSRTCT